MEIIDANLPGVKVLEPHVFPDARGWFSETFSARRYEAAGIDHRALVQDNQSRSVRRVIRGLHTRSELREAKLVRCARGAVFDVAVDLRPWSPSFGHWQGFELDDLTQRQVYIPPGFAHGFQALTDVADVCYRVDAYYEPSVMLAIAWDDPDIGIDWPIADPILSDQDRSARRLRDLHDQLTSWYGHRAPP